MNPAQFSADLFEYIEEQIGTKYHNIILSDWWVGVISCCMRLHINGTKEHSILVQHIFALDKDGSQEYDKYLYIKIRDNSEEHWIDSFKIDISNPNFINEIVEALCGIKQ